MGLQDRPYYQDDPTRSAFVSQGRSMVTNLIIVNVAIFVVDAFILPKPRPGTSFLAEIFAVQSTTLLHPLTWWRFLTYGFMHSTDVTFHVIGNMLGLFFLGREVEARYGGKLFLKMYLTALVFCSLLWGITEVAMGRSMGSLIGASGAVTTVVLLFALNFPRRTILFMMFIPMPAWVLGVLIVLMNLFSYDPAGVASGQRVAYDVHLMGAFYGFIFFKTQWAFGSWFDRFGTGSGGGWKFRIPRPGPKLRVHDPGGKHTSLDRKADAVLEKLHREGQDSLSPSERKVLEDYSRRMKQKHQ